MLLTIKCILREKKSLCHPVTILFAAERWTPLEKHAIAFFIVAACAGPGCSGQLFSNTLLIQNKIICTVWYSVTGIYSVLTQRPHLKYWTRFFLCVIRQNYRKSLLILSRKRFGWGSSAATLPKSIGQEHIHYTLLKGVSSCHFCNSL